MEMEIRHQERSCGGKKTHVKIGFCQKKFKVMIMIMNFFGHEHDHYEKNNNVTKIRQIIDLEGIISPTEK